jgi:hypothetical protein
MLKDKIQTILNFKKATLKKSKSINEIEIDDFKKATHQANVLSYGIEIDD